MTTPSPYSSLQSPDVGAATAQEVYQSAIKLLAACADVARASGPNVPSPCVSICRMDAASGWCVGCLRTLDEIALWSRSSDADKQRIWGSLAQRATLLTADPLPESGPIESHP
jgi:predicted Fe-S protein YdhL (DUF1289 family)